MANVVQAGRVWPPLQQCNTEYQEVMSDMCTTCTCTGARVGSGISTPQWQPQPSSLTGVRHAHTVSPLQECRPENGIRREENERRREEEKKSRHKGEYSES